MTTILGLDIGVASVGFALISRRADGRQVRILRMGVRVFPEGRTEDKQEPRNLERRTARLRRRAERIDSAGEIDLKVDTGYALGA